MHTNYKLRVYEIQMTSPVCSVQLPTGARVQLIEHNTRCGHNHNRCRLWAFVDDAAPLKSYFFSCLKDGDDANGLQQSTHLGIMKMNGETHLIFQLGSQ